LIFLAIPFLIYGLNQYDAEHKIYERINNEYINKYLYMNVNPETIQTIRQYTSDLSRKTSDYYSTGWNGLKDLSWAIKDTAIYISTVFIPEKLDAILNKTYDVTKKAADYLYDFKPSSFGGHDITNNLLNIDRDSLLSDLDKVKEKILAETLSKFNDAKHADIELIRQELDQKFNYTVSQISNKMADQLLEIENVKNTYENELSQIKGVLGELESRYKFLLNQVQEQRVKAQEEVAAHATTAASIQQQADNTLRSTFSDENISFRKIEEYINRTFYRYNADKTGMTDFASESIGGAILFTRCTEAYTDNSRWFTVFDVPITRVQVSPRVVIQVSFIFIFDCLV
jgi:hypothetical protein